MTLRTWLKEADCKTIKIGYADGSQFVYCGPLANSRLTEILEETSKRYRDYQTKRLERLKNQIAACERELSLPESALSRKVVEVYPSQMELGQMIVNIEGINDGKYWDISEYEQGVEVDE